MYSLFPVLGCSMIEVERTPNNIAVGYWEMEVMQVLPCNLLHIGNRFLYFNFIFYKNLDYSCRS